LHLGTPDAVCSDERATSSAGTWIAVHDDRHEQADVSGGTSTDGTLIVETRCLARDGEVTRTGT
jgi:hypothetical protein